MRDCSHNPLEVLLIKIPPLSWIIDLWIKLDTLSEFWLMEKLGYESYIGHRYDKKGDIVAGGVVCWKRKK